MAQPNIVFITSDQQRSDCYGFAGKSVKTPHLDKLRAEGMHFSSCITPAPVCQPARAAILTGKLPKTNGVKDNGIDLRPEVGGQSFAAALSEAGYQTALIGKAHFATTQTFTPQPTPECKSGSAEYPPSWTGPYMGFDYVELVTQGHWHKIRPPVLPPSGQHYENWFFNEVGGAEGFELWKSETQPNRGAAQTWASALPVAWHSSSWVGDRAIDWISKQKEETPFCIWVSFPDPHHPFDCPEPWSMLHDPSDVELPEFLEKDLDRRPWWHRQSLEAEPEIKDPVLKKFRKQGSRMPDQSEEQLREMTANYYGMISLIDHNVGRIVNCLKEKGMLDNTIIIYTSDHGDHMGERGLYLKGPMLYDSLLNVGMIVRGPGVEPGGSNNQPVTTLDVGATFCEYAGTSMPAEAQSQSLKACFEGGASPHCAVYSEWDVAASRCGVRLDLRTVHTGDAKLTVELQSGAGELYDLTTDKNEMYNLWDDPQHAALQEKLEALLWARPGIELVEFDAPIGVA